MPYFSFILSIANPSSVSIDTNTSITSALVLPVSRVTPWVALICCCGVAQPIINNTILKIAISLFINFLLYFYFLKLNITLPIIGIFFFLYSFIALMICSLFIFFGISINATYFEQPCRVRSARHGAHFLLSLRGLSRAGRGNSTKQSVLRVNHLLRDCFAEFTPYLILG